MRITRAGEATHSLVVFVDEHGTARRLAMLRGGVAAEIGRRAGGPGARATTLEEVPVEVACAHARQAIKDGYGDHRLALSETFADLRALTLATIVPWAGPPNSLLYR